jgi:hypothetical protein
MRLLSQVRFYIPVGQAVPPEVVKKYQAAYYRAVRKASGHRRKAVGTIKAYQEKVARPLVRKFASMFNPDFVSRTGLTAEEIIKDHTQSTMAGGRKYLTKLARAYKKMNGIPAKLIKDKLAVAGEHYAQSMAYAFWPLISGSQPGAQGPVIKAQLWLVGDQSVLNHLTEPDEVLTGEPVLITEPAQRGIFKKQLNSRLIQAGARLLKVFPDLSASQAGLSAEQAGWAFILQKENDRTNRLVQQFARSEFVPFTTGGDSHLDFIVRLLDPALFPKRAGELSLDPVARSEPRQRRAGSRDDPSDAEHPQDAKQNPHGQPTIGGSNSSRPAGLKLPPIVKEIPDPNVPTKLIKQLYLEVQVAKA